MSHKVFNNANHAAMSILRNQDSRFVRGNEENETVLYISVALAVPAKTVDEKYSERVKSSKVVTDMGNIEIAELPDDARIAFTVSIASANKASFTQKALSAANDETFNVESTFTVFTDGDTANGIQPHLGYDMPEKQALALIRNHVQKLGGTRQWKKAKGIYSEI